MTSSSNVIQRVTAEGWIAASETLSFDIGNFIDGGRRLTRGKDRLHKISPRDGRLLYSFNEASRSDVDEAVATARRASIAGCWSRKSAEERCEILLNLSSLISRNLDELALLECLDVGKPISAARSFDIPTAAAIVKFNAQAADKIPAKVYSANHSGLAYQLRRPAGVVAAIVGWNFPLLLAVTKIAPALAAGNSVILKPSELTALSALRLAELAHEAGVPAGVFNVVLGGGRIGASLGHHSGVNLISFTGSSQTGKALLVASGQSNMKRLVLECGGKAANMVFDDCENLEMVANGIVARVFWNQGEVCTASSRLLVQEGIKDELLRLVIERTAHLIFGDPLSPETTFGAIVSRDHMEKISAYAVCGEMEGARLAYSSPSRPPHKDGFYVPPMIFDDVSTENKIAQEEIFGPILSVITFRDEAEAIRIANETIYGLSAIVWTRDIGRAHRVVHGTDVAWLEINATDSPLAADERGALPVSAHKASGMGTEGGIEGLEEYTTSTTVQVFV